MSMQDACRRGRREGGTPRRTRGALVALQGTVLLLLLAGCGDDENTSFGTFSSRATVTHIGDGCWRLEADLTYTDPAGKTWKAPAGLHTDGASIPSWAWSPLGSPPMGGDYVEAAVVHDHYCVERQHGGTDSDEVHRMFYCACRCNGVSEFKAKTLYYGVLVGGPDWKVTDTGPKGQPACGPPPTDPVILPVPKKLPPRPPADWEASRDWIRDAKPSLEQIAARARTARGSG